jgi:hypothetical protein
MRENRVREAMRGVRFIFPETMGSQDKTFSFGVGRVK